MAAPKGQAAGVSLIWHDAPRFFHQLFISPHTVSHARISPAAPLAGSSRQRHNASFARHLIMRISVPLAHAYRLLNHGPLTLISSAHADQRNIMAAARAMPVDFQPPKVAVVIDKSSHTRQLIEASWPFCAGAARPAIGAYGVATGQPQRPRHRQIRRFGRMAPALNTAAACC